MVETREILELHGPWFRHRDGRWVDWSEIPMEGCPFCGHAGENSPRLWQQENGLWMVECIRCGANGPKEKTREAARAMWDTRQHFRGRILDPLEPSKDYSAEEAAYAGLSPGVQKSMRYYWRRSGELDAKRIAHLERVIDRAGALASQKAPHDLIREALAEAKHQQQ